MRIACPTCGGRTNDEFSYLGDADHLLARPATQSLATMTPYIYDRPNPAGPHRELWYHQSGCRQWLVVTRDTRTHEIFAVAYARDVMSNSIAAPSMSEGAA